MTGECQPTPAWGLRTVRSELAAHYRSRGWWDSRSLGELIAESLNDCKAMPFTVHSVRRPWRGTVGEVAASAQRFASWLRRRGIGPGHVVVMQLPNCVEAAVTFWGAAMAGAVVVPVVHFYGGRELEHVLRTTQPSLLVTPDRFGRQDYVGALAGLTAELELPWVIVAHDGPADAAIPTGTMRFTDTLEVAETTRASPADPAEPAIIAFTSGTTRVPKGVVHSHRSIGFEARQSAGISPRGVPPPLVAAPVGHFMGMLSALLGSLIRRVPIHLLDEWNPERVLGLLLDEDVGITGGAPYFFISLLDHPDFTEKHLRGMPNAGLGGAPVAGPLARRLEELGIRVMRCYGSTEHPTTTGCDFDEPAGRRLTTDGHPLTGVDVRLDENGQICSRGPDLFIGYTDERLTAAAFDDDGWYRTGDVGRIDPEGNLTITDRISDVIIRGGENISAQEVEELLMAMPQIAEVAVVSEPDDKFGERAVAVIRTQVQHGALDLDALRQHLAAAGMAKQKWPESIRLVSDFPRTPSGKIQKFALRNAIRTEGLSSNDR